MLGRGLALPALLPQFIRTDRSIGLQVLVLAITSEAIELLVLVRYGVAAGRIAELVRTVSYL
jgi:threonine/homoserine/homoserine lactone efflux protein